MSGGNYRIPFWRGYCVLSYMYFGRLPGSVWISSTVAWWSCERRGFVPPRRSHTEIALWKSVVVLLCPKVINEFNLIAWPVLLFQELTGISWIFLKQLTFQRIIFQQNRCLSKNAIRNVFKTQVAWCLTILSRIPVAPYLKMIRPNTSLQIQSSRDT